MAERATFIVLLVALWVVASPASYKYFEPKELRRRAKIEWEKYCALSRLNTACVNQCKTSRLCSGIVNPADKVGEEETKGSTRRETRLLITDIVNRIRAKQARGYSGFPPAANMRAVSYDRECEMLALCGVRTCQRLNYYVHITLDGTTLGMTGYDIMSFERKRQRIGPKEIENAFNGWQDSFKGPLTDRHKFERVVETIMNQQAPGFADDFLQVVWANVTYIGCVFTEKLTVGKTYLYQLVCTYKPSYVKMRNMKPYLEGPPASRCGQNITPNAQYPELCGSIRPLEMDWFTNYFRDELSSHSPSRTLSDLTLICLQLCIVFVFAII